MNVTVLSLWNKHKEINKESPLQYAIITQEFQFDTIIREYGGCHHDSLMWVTIWTYVLHECHLSDEQRDVSNEHKVTLLFVRFIHSLSKFRPTQSGVQPTKSPICLKFVSYDQGFVWCSSNPYATFGETRQRSGCSNFHNCVQVRPIITNLGPRLPKTFSRTLFHSCVKCVKAIQW